MHFKVLVVGEDVDNILRPFQQGGREIFPIEQLKFIDEEEKLRQQAEKIIEVDSYLGKSNLEAAGKTYLDYYGKGDFSTFVKEWNGSNIDNIKNRYGYWLNPKGQWDWYVIGGRFSGELKLNGGAEGQTGEPGIPQLLGIDSYELEEDYVDSARKKDIDFSTMNSKCYKELCAEYSWWKETNKKEQEQFLHCKEDVPREGETQLEYADRLFVSWTCYAIVIKGEWYSNYYYDYVKEEMVEVPEWEGVFWDKLNSVDDEEVITVVDVHN